MVPSPEWCSDSDLEKRSPWISVDVAPCEHTAISPDLPVATALDRATVVVIIFLTSKHSYDSGRLERIGFSLIELISGIGVKFLCHFD